MDRRSIHGTGVPVQVGASHTVCWLDRTEELGLMVLAGLSWEAGAEVLQAGLGRWAESSGVRWGR